MAGRLGERMPKVCLLGVRRIDVHQDVVESGRSKQDRVESLLGKARVFLGKASGEMAWSKKLISRLVHADGAPRKLEREEGLGLVGELVRSSRGTGRSGV
jgi:hypothetical protein